MDRKRVAFDAFKKAFEEEIASATRDLKSTHKDHNESSNAMQSRYDTWKEEAEALGVGQMMSLENRIRDIRKLNRLEGACMVIRERIAVGALVVLEGKMTEEERRYYLVPGGGGRKITVGNEEFVCVNLGTPVAKALITKEEGDIVRLSVNKVMKKFEVIGVE